METLSRQTHGVIPIVPTPFDPSGAVALDDVGKLVDYYARCGVIGLTILGVMGEANKLTSGETDRIVDAFLEAAKDRLPVVVGVTGPSLAGTVELARRSVERGAAGVMLQAMTGLKDDDGVVGYFKAFIDQTQGQVPVCVQDYPTASGVHLSVDAWCRLSAFDAVFMLKHEPFPGLQKLTKIRAAEEAGRARRVSILTSNNAMHLSQELGRGADGAMVGVAYSDLIVKICALHRAGETGRAYDLYDAVLPLARHENQGPFGLAIRKEILRRRGALTSNTVRYPGATLDGTDLAELDGMMARLDRRLAELGA
jgi:4-hydroxy-tetrahydrodipicolinate synthase